MTKSNDDVKQDADPNYWIAKINGEWVGGFKSEQFARETKEKIESGELRPWVPDDQPKAS